MGSSSTCSSNYWVLNLLLVGFCWLLFVGLMMQSSTERGNTSSSSSRRAVLMGRASPRHHEEVLLGNKEKQELVHSPELDLNYVMRKRRVPNGPDPIHNRKRPPGQA